MGIPPNLVSWDKNVGGITDLKERRMVQLQDVTITAGIFVFSLLGQLVRASYDDILAGMSTPELNNLLEELEYNNQDYGQGLQQSDANDYLDYGALPALDDFKHVDQRSDQSKTSGGGATGDKASSRSTAAAAAAMLPAYCDPPNPCPPGYTNSDGCIEDFENSSEFSRNYQASQKCICDTEHMFNCPPSPPTAQHPTPDTGFLSELPGLTADGRENPFLGGQKLPVAAKKGMDFN